MEKVTAYPAKKPKENILCLYTHAVIMQLTIGIDGL